MATAAQIDIDKTKLVERDNQLSRRVSQLTYYVNTIFSCLSYSGVWHLHGSDCEQAADNEADYREAERQAWDCLQGGLWVKMLYTILKHFSTILLFKRSTVAVFRISPILSTSYVRTDQLPARVISLMWTSCVICIRWIIRKEILNFFPNSSRSLACINIPIFQEIRAMLS